MLEKHTRSSNLIALAIVAIYFVIISIGVSVLSGMPKPDCKVHNDNKLLELFMCDGTDGQR